MLFLKSRTFSLVFLDIQMQMVSPDQSQKVLHQLLCSLHPLPLKCKSQQLYLQKTSETGKFPADVLKPLGSNPQWSWTQGLTAQSLSELLLEQMRMVIIQSVEDFFKVLNNCLWVNPLDQLVVDPSHAPWTTLSQCEPNESSWNVPPIRKEESNNLIIQERLRLLSFECSTATSSAELQVVTCSDIAPLGAGLAWDWLLSSQAK